MSRPTNQLTDGPVSRHHILTDESWQFKLDQSYCQLQMAASNAKVLLIGPRHPKTELVSPLFEKSLTDEANLQTLSRAVDVRFDEPLQSVASHLVVTIDETLSVS